MYRSLLALTNWLQNTRMALAVGGSDWAYPYIQLTHFTGLSVWLGTSVAVDLSLMGVGRRKQAASQLLDALFVWNWVGFGIAVLGGFLLFSIAATSFVSNAAFRVKLGILLPLALGMHILIQTKTRAWSRAECPPTVAKLAGLVELLLWMSVVAAAVSIPYVR